VRRWFRRQDRLTRRLLLAVAVLGVVVAALVVPLRDRDRPGGRAPGPTGKASAHRPAEEPRAAGTARPATVSARSVSRPDRPRNETAPAARPAVLPRAARADGNPRLAIVIDDLGQKLPHLQELAALELPLTVAVIPGLPATAATVREAGRLGIEMILHQPMEPREEGGKDAGAGVLLVSMGPAEVRSRVAESLAAVPGAVGVNNHMGSRFTEEATALAPLMAELKARDLFWLDSRTTAATRGVEAARAAGVPVLERDVFLDAEVNPDFIRAQVRRAVVLARERGQAVGIGHPHPETIAALRELRGELLASGVALVRLSALVPRGGDAGTAVAAASRPAKERAGRTAVALP
jgi:polysaccharide deacetylase 2 family uncharacterized protein YibQ